LPEYLKLSRELQGRFPGLAAQIVRFSGVTVARESPELELYKTEIANRIRERWDIEELREHPTFRAYRDFFWKMGIDPPRSGPPLRPS